MRNSGLLKRDGRGWWRVVVAGVVAVVPTAGTVVLVTVGTGVSPSSVLVVVTYAGFMYLHARKESPRLVVAFACFVVGVLGFLGPFVVVVAMIRTGITGGPLGPVGPASAGMVLLSAVVTGWVIAFAGVYAARRIEHG